MINIQQGGIYKALFPNQKEHHRVVLSLMVADLEGEVKCSILKSSKREYADDILLNAADIDDIDENFQFNKFYVNLRKPVYIPEELFQNKLGMLKPASFSHLMRQQVIQAVEEFFPVEHGTHTFVPGVSAVPPAGRVYGVEELTTLVDSSLDFWLTTGRYNDLFEKRLAEFVGINHVLTTNSGSSSNLLAVTALTSPSLGNRAIKPGDEVITVAAGFPTTVNPIIQNSLIPVFVDIKIPTYNIHAELIEEAISEKTKAVMLAHTLGNPFDLDIVMELAEKYNLWVIEDCCDALGSRYQGKMVGTFGHIGTCSFYPAHHITMGEGGVVFTNSSKLMRIIRSFRDWGRDCWCAPGKDNTCKKRFDWELGSLPHGYDHKYMYSHVGYNLKISDMQAAVGYAQMDRLESFIHTRHRNFALLKKMLSDIEEFFVLPEATPDSEPSWFGFPLTIRDSTKIVREDLLKFLNERKIGTRLLFGGNLTRQPYFQEVHYRVSGSLQNTDQVMYNTFWLGIYPGITEDMLVFVAESLNEFLRDRLL